MKTLVKYILQRILGFDNYLFVFALFKTYTLHWDKNENHFFYFLKLIPSNGVFVDIGANIGIMTACAGRKYANLNIVAVEPIEKNIKALRRVIRFFNLKNVQAHQVALGNKNGSVKMVMPIQNKVRFQGLSHVLHESITDNNEGEVNEVNLYRLDDFEPIKNINKPISGIKMDVENFESFVVKGGLEQIRKNQPVLYIELWNNDNRRTCLQDLSDLGYLPFTFNLGRLVPYDASKHNHHNFFFLHQNKLHEYHLSEAL